MKYAISMAEGNMYFAHGKLYNIVDRIEDADKFDSVSDALNGLYRASSSVARSTQGLKSCPLGEDLRIVQVQPKGWVATPCRIVPDEY